MTAATVPLAAGAPDALTAFLRGVERRGAVFAELLCGDAVRGDAALATAMRAFRNAAARGPVADWPQRFWSLLLAVPQLREAAPERRWPATLSALARLGTGPRAALLLRLAAGLDEADAAAVLGIACPTYRLALQRALPQLPDGGPDTAGWRALAEATQRTLRQLPAERLVRLAQARDAALQGGKPESSAAPRRSRAQRDASGRPRWLRPVLWMALAACAIAFTGTFFFLPAALRGDDMPHIHATALPAAELPVATFDADTALLTHRDFDQLVDVRDDALVRDLDFYAWYASRAAAQPGADGAPLLLPDAGAPLSNPASEGSHAPR